MYCSNDEHDRSMSILKNTRKYLNLIISVVILVMIGFILLMLKENYSLFK